MNTESIEPEEVLTEESAQENTSCKPVRQEQTIMFYMPLMETFEPNGEIEVPIKEYPANDTGNARRFLDLFQNGLRYCAAEKEWYCFHKTCWVKDTTCIVPQLAKLGLEYSYQAEAQYAAEQGDYKKLPLIEKQRVKAGNMSTLQNCLNMAALSVVISPDAFDADPYLFHAVNGHIDLRNYEVYLMHDHLKYFTKTAGAALDPSAFGTEPDCEPRCPRWIKFVTECAGGDMELYNYLNRAAGYSILTGDIREQKIFCLSGEGRNGKSLFINTLAAIAGDYASKIEASVLSVNRFGDKDSDMSKELYRIRGSRFVYSNEFGRNSILNETLAKTITDGGVITCRTLFKESIAYKPTYTLWFSTNHMPNLQAMDEGIRRRIVVIPFRNHLTEEEIDRDLADKLLEEADAILYWLIQGYYRYTVHGLKPPAAVRETTAGYFAGQDLYQLFIEEHYVKDADGKVYAKTLYQNYQHWCAENGEKPVSNIRLGKELQRLGIERKKDMFGVFYYLHEIKHDEIQDNMTII